VTGSNADHDRHIIYEAVTKPNCKAQHKEITILNGLRHVNIDAISQERNPTVSTEKARTVGHSTS